MPVFAVTPVAAYAAATLTLILMLPVARHADAAH